MGFAEDGKKVLIHNNTGTNTITINIDENAHASMVQILSTEGIVVWTEHTNERELTLDLNYFPIGTYTIQVSIFDQVQTYTFVRR